VTVTSAGLLLYRIDDAGLLSVWLVHPGGPYWRNKDEAAWSIPKGEYVDGENPRDVALAAAFGADPTVPGGGRRTVADRSGGHTPTRQGAAADPRCVEGAPRRCRQAVPGAVIAPCSTTCPSGRARLFRVF